MKQTIAARDYNKPLPKHTKTNFWECYARLVLQFIDDKAYSGLVLSDKPDLINPNVSLGVEVTDALPK